MQRPYEGMPNRDTSYDQANLINRTMERMMEHEEKGNTFGQWIAFKFLFRRLMIYIDKPIRVEVENDYQLLMGLERAILRRGDNQQSVKNEINDLRKNFMDAHESFLFSALPKANIITSSEDAMIDFNKANFEELIRLVNYSGKDKEGGKLGIFEELKIKKDEQAKLQNQQDEQKGLDE